MSEYQYYEFQAIDRPLDRKAQEALREVSSRARITATSFTNHYEWGDFKGDARQFMERWFDLHLYFTNWGSRRLMIRLPKRVLDSSDLDPFLREVEWVQISTSGENVIVDIDPDAFEADDVWSDGSERLAMLAPLRADLMSGDLRLFYLLWLMAVEYELIADDEVEPMPGIGPLTGPLQGFAEFYFIDPDLVQAAAEQGAGIDATPSEDLRDMLSALPESEKIALLLRVVDGDTHVASELKARFRKKQAAPETLRTVGALRERARQIAEEREIADAAREKAERRRKIEEAEKARSIRLKDLKRRGATVWGEIEEQIERRNASGYDHAADLISDLQALADQEGTQASFRRQLASIRMRHENKRKFIERLDRL